MLPDYKQLARRWADEVWSGGRLDVVDEMTSPDCVVHVEGQDGPLGRDAFKQYLQAFLSAVPDLDVKALSITTEGTTSVLTWRATGTHRGPGLGIPPSGGRLDFTAVSLLRFDGDLMVRGRDWWNRGEVIASLMVLRHEDLCGRSGLTSREAQVARMLADRLTYKEIARELQIRPNTARRHTERVLLKLGVTRRQDVAGALGRTSGSVLARHGSDLAPPGGGSRQA